MVGHSVVRPDGVVELFHYPLLFGAVHLQGEGADGVLSQHQGVVEVDTHGIKHLCPLHLIWPVLVALDLEERDSFILRLMVCSLTLPFSSVLVSMTMVAVPCSHTILQKSVTVAGTGP